MTEIPNILKFGLETAPSPHSQASIISLHDGATTTTTTTTTTTNKLSAIKLLNFSYFTDKLKNYLLLGRDQFFFSFS